MCVEVNSLTLHQTLFQEPRELRIVFKPSKVSLLKLISRCLKVQIITSRKAGQHVLFFQVMTLCYLMGREHLAFLETLGLLKPWDLPYLGIPQKWVWLARLAALTSYG